jgi:hypothetical protein
MEGINVELAAAYLFVRIDPICWADLAKKRPCVMRRGGILIGIKRRGIGVPEAKRSDF